VSTATGNVTPNFCVKALHGRPLHIHGDGPAVKILAAMFLVEFLPNWQVIAAASPTGPTVNQHAFAPGKSASDTAPPSRRGDAEVRGKLADAGGGVTGHNVPSLEREAYRTPVPLKWVLKRAPAPAPPPLTQSHHLFEQNFLDQGATFLEQATTASFAGIPLTAIWASRSKSEAAT